MKNVGIDLGTSTVKISCGDQQFLIPSVIGEPNPGWTGTTFEKDLSKNLVLIEGRDKYYIGELARMQSEVKRALASDGQMKSAEETFLAIKAALSLLLENDNEDVNIATGVPVATPLDSMKNLSKMLKGNLEIYVKNDATDETKRLNVNVNTCMVLPEPYGTYYKTLKDRGEDTAVDTVIIDIGHGSTDILTMYQGRPMRTASGSMREATDTLTSRMAKSLQDKTGSIIKPFDLMSTIRKQKETVMIGGQTYSIKKIKNFYADQISKVMVDEVMRLISNLPPDAFVEYYIICGGGAYTFGDTIREAIIDKKLVASPENVVIPDDPVLSNAVGFELVANAKS
ncbi:MAG: ParM/StbA family protein [Promethearchaeia archaeon]